MNIIWDFDGTLFDTYPALVKAFIQLSGQELDPNEVLAWLKKDSKTAFKHYRISEDHRNEYQELYNCYSKEGSLPFPNLKDALKAAGQNIIVTHRDRESTAFLLEKFDLKQYFTDIVSVEEDGFIRKPDPSSYKYVLSKYEIDLTIGDRDLDLIPAKKVGLKTAAFQNPNIDADYHFDHYKNFRTTVLDHFER